MVKGLTLTLVVALSLAITGVIGISVSALFMWVLMFMVWVAL